MNFHDLGITLERMSTPFPLWRSEVEEIEWREIALAVAEGHGRLVTIWGSQRPSKRFVVSAVYSSAESGLLWLDFTLPKGNMTYPDLSTLFPCATRLQRAMKDLLGIEPDGGADLRPWLNHGRWSKEYFPLRKEFSGKEIQVTTNEDDYEFVEVAGEGVHEIAVGPVHAGIIEPGHFRFSVVGEKTLRLEERLGYAHKGVDKLFESFPATDGFRLAGRVSGDSTVAYSWAYCMALEAAWQWNIPLRAVWLRALLLERERIANHLGDLGAIGNDAGFTFGLTHFMRLKEGCLRLNKTLFGHRFSMDVIRPGGVNVDIDDEGVNLLLAQCDFIESELGTLRGIYDEHSGLQDRFLGTGIVTPSVATELGLIGLAGRASGVSEDVRVTYPSSPYTEMAVNIAGAESGDVAGRVEIRFDEILESLRLLRELLSELPAGAINSTTTAPKKSAIGAGYVEGWRGGVFVSLSTLKNGDVDRCHVHDPSWQNWPVIEFAVIGDIVPDFPLINKSFNLTYSGHDK